MPLWAMWLQVKWHKMVKRYGKLTTTEQVVLMLGGFFAGVGALAAIGLVFFGIQTGPAIALCMVAAIIFIVYVPISSGTEPPRGGWR